MSAKSVPVVVFNEPSYGSMVREGKRDRVLKSVKPIKEFSLKQIKTEIGGLTAQSTKQRRNYRYNRIVELGGEKEKRKTMPLPLKKKIIAARNKRLQKSVELGDLDARFVAKMTKNVKKRKSGNRRKKTNHPAGKDS